MACLFLTACFGGGGGSGAAPKGSTGGFAALTTNLRSGTVWQLNRVVRIEFNHPLDPRSVSLRSVVFRPVSAQVQGQPVTGSFELESGSNDRVLLFRPTCPTNQDNSNGGLVPGGWSYELLLPTQGSFGGSVLRDRDGRALESGLSVAFRTPVYPQEPLFVDFVAGAPRILEVDWPQGLNLFLRPDPFVRIVLDQPIDARPSNLGGDGLYLLYSDEEIPGGGGASTFPDANRVPGRLLVAENCTDRGAEVLFQVSGLLPPNRRLRLVMSPLFRDLVGERNSAAIVWPGDHDLPTLADYFLDPAWNDADEAYDEFREDFLDGSGIDLGAALPLPSADIDGGTARASFDFPGGFASSDADLELKDGYTEIFTDGTSFFTDSFNRTYTLRNGVLVVDDLTIRAGSYLRVRGKNPLVIYATGDVILEGGLDASGNNATSPRTLNTPTYPEGGAAGEGGGGDGGTSSQITTGETPRGEAGDGPFGQIGAGGGGGEGGIQQLLNLGGTDEGTWRSVVGGGAGGNFSLTPNVAVVWDRWSGPQNPTSHDDEGPDHDVLRHPEYHRDPADPTYTGPPAAWGLVFGGENGNRGSSAETDQTNLNRPHGVFGMEDVAIDTVAYDGPPDPGGDAIRCLWADPKNDGVGPTATDPEWVLGDPVLGPDGGNKNESVFTNDLLASKNDFWGTRLANGGGVIAGELLAPWAGYGGGAGGDSQIINRTVAGTRKTIPEIYPDRPWGFFGGPQTDSYRKSAPGGGGAGQILVLAIGEIRIGAQARLKVDGGIGNGGEGLGASPSQVSGSGGGSGGHLVLHSATRVDLSAIDLGANPANPVVADLITAIGGRRGWSGTNLDRCTAEGRNADGNPDFQIGRGGAGGNGIVQIHVPDPGRDILWWPPFQAAFDAYVHGGTTNGPLDIDRVEELLDYYCAPRPYALIPFFAAKSQLQSKWIDSGLASLRDPDGSGDWPKWAGPALALEGLDLASGEVERVGTRVAAQGEAFTGTAAQGGFEAFALEVPSASALVSALFLREPELLHGYDLLPNRSEPLRTYEIVGATYDRAADRLRMVTRSEDGALSFGVGPQWSVRRKFFRIATSGLKDFLPLSSAMWIEFQAADDPEDFASYAPFPGNANTWTADLALLEGKRWLRWRATFDINADDAGVGLNNPLPTLDYLKVPFAW